MYNNWSPQDVHNFVLDIGVRYKKIAQTLLDAGVNGSFLVTLEDSDLQDLGVNVGFDRKRLLFAISELRAEPVATNSSSSSQQSVGQSMEKPEKMSQDREVFSQPKVPPPPPIRQQSFPNRSISIDSSPRHVVVQANVQMKSSPHRKSVPLMSAEPGSPFSFQPLTQRNESRRHPNKQQHNNLKFPESSFSESSRSRISSRSPPDEAMRLAEYHEEKIKSRSQHHQKPVAQSKESVDKKSHSGRVGHRYQELEPDLAVKYAFKNSEGNHGDRERNQDFRHLPDLPMDIAPGDKQLMFEDVNPALYDDDDLCWLCDVCSKPNDMSTLICQSCGTEHTDEPDGLELLHLQPTRPSDEHEADMDFRSNIQVLCMVHNPMPDDIDRMLGIVEELRYPETLPVFLDIENYQLNGWLEKAEFMEFLYLLGFEFLEQGPVCKVPPSPAILDTCTNILTEKREELDNVLSDSSHIRMYITGMDKNERQSMIDFFKSYLAKYQPKSADRFMDGILICFNKKVNPNELTHLLRSTFESNMRSDLASSITVTSLEEDTIENEEEFATLQLISFLSHESFLDDRDVIAAFFLFHTAFTTSAEVLKAVDRRFNSCGDGASEEQSRRIRIKLANLLKFWIKHYPVDLIDDNTQHLLQCVISKMETMDILTGICSQLRALLKTVEVRGQKPRSDTGLSDTPATTRDILGEDPRIIANQLSLMDQELFSQIKDREFVGKAWMKADRYVKASGIMKMIHRFEGVSRWAKLSVLRETSQDRRVNRVKWLIKICLRLRELNNCGSMMAIFCSLSSPEVQKFTRVWKKVFDKSMFGKRNYRNKWAELTELLSTSRNHKKLREYHMNMPAPAIPHIGCVLKDLVRIDDSEKRRTSRMDFFVLFRKSQIVIDRIKRFQQFPYDLRPYPLVQSALAADFTVQRHLTQQSIDALFMQALTVDGYEIPERLLRKMRGPVVLNHRR